MCKLKSDIHQAWTGKIFSAYHLSEELFAVVVPRRTVILVADSQERSGTPACGGRDLNQRTSTWSAICRVAFDRKQSGSVSSFQHDDLFVFLAKYRVFGSFSNRNSSLILILRLSELMCDFRQT